MSQFISDYRAKYPEYSDLDDSQLTQALHKKYNADTGADLTLEDFNSAIEYTTSPSGDIAEQGFLEAAGNVASRIGSGILSGIKGAPAQLQQQAGGLMRSLGSEAPSRPDIGTLDIVRRVRSGDIPSTYSDDMVKALQRGTEEEAALELTKFFKGARNPIGTAVAKAGESVAADAKSRMHPQQAEKGSPEYYAQAITGSVLNMIPALGVSMLSRRPDIGMGIMLAQSKGGSYQGGRESGLTPEEAQTYSSLMGAAEAIPSAIPIAAILRPTGKFIKDLVTAGVTEGAQEAVTSALQSMVDKGYISPDMTFGDALDQMIESAIIGAGSGAAISGSTSQIMPAIESRAERKQIEAEIEQSIDNAMAGKQDSSQALSPENAQLYQDFDGEIKAIKAKPPEEKTMGEMVKEKLHDAGINPADIPAWQAAPQPPQSMVEQEPVAFDVPAETEQIDKGPDLAPEPAPDLTSAQVDRLDYTTGIKDVATSLGIQFDKGESASSLRKKIKTAALGDTETVSPEEYKAFKKDATRPQLHGTSQKIDKLQEGAYASQNIYGQGLYTTDSPDMAKGYTGKGKGTDPAVYKVNFKREPKLYDMEQPIDSDTRSFLDSLDSEVINVALDEAGSLREVYDIARQSSQSYGVSSDVLQEDFQAIADHLSDSGFDGLRHVGGAFTGNKPHNVEIIFNPSELVELSEQEAATPEDAIDEVDPKLKQQAEFSQSVSAGTASKQSVESNAKAVSSNKDSAIKSIKDSNATREQLQEVAKSPRTNLTKPELAENLYRQTMMSNVFSDAAIVESKYTPSLEDQVTRLTETQTDEDISESYEDQRQIRAQEQKAKRRAYEASGATSKASTSKKSKAPSSAIGKTLDYADVLPGHRVLNLGAESEGLEPYLAASEVDAIIESREAPKKSKGDYDRVVIEVDGKRGSMDALKSAFNQVRPGGKLIATLPANSSLLKSPEAKAWLDESGHYIDRGSFESGDQTVLTVEKNDNQTLSYKSQDSKVLPATKDGDQIFNAPGHNFIGTFKSMGIPERRDYVYIEGRKLNIPEKPQRIEPILVKLTQIMGRRIYHGKIKGKSEEGFYRPDVGEIRTRRKNDVEVLAHEMAHYLDVYSNIKLPNFAKLYKQKKYSPQVTALSYTDSTNDLQHIEGFAEFVRLWLTNAKEAELRAPDFYDAFTKLLASDRKLLNPMRDMQDMMHRFYFQGPDKLGQALIGKDRSYLWRFNEWKYRRDSRFRQQGIDRFHAARKIEQELTGKISGANESAWKMFRIANGGAEGIADYVMNYKTVNFGEDGSLVPTGKSLHDVLQPVKKIKRKPEHRKDSKIDLLMRYFSGRRALELHRQGRENLIPKESAKAWARLGSDYPIFEEIHREYSEFNSRMMDFYVESGLITPEGRQAMESLNKDYVPFNRIRETLANPDGKKAAGFQRLRGGTANLNDILVNIQDGIESNVRAALNNRAKQRLYQYISNHRDGAIFATTLATDSKKVTVNQEELAKKIGDVLAEAGVEVDGAIDLTDPKLMDFWQHGVKPQLNESGNMVDTVVINGKRKYYEVQDPLLQEMLLGMNPESYSTFMNVMFGAKNLFTRSITLGVEFMGANLVRDTIGATFLSKEGFRPFIDSFSGMWSYMRKDAAFQAFMRSGGGYSGRVHGSTREGFARRRVRVDEFGVMTAPERLLSSLDNIASAFEYGTRIGEFKLAKKNKKSDIDAAFAAREISTDFSVLGANHFLTGYIRTVPFFNAMIQSQDRIFREAFIRRKYDGNPQGLAIKATLGITVPTLLLWLINKDDEEYQNIPDYEKRTNWHFKMNDGQYVKIPRPYDVGFVFATMPELFFNYTQDEKGREFAEGMAWTMLQMYGIDGVPAVATGWWDLVRNKKWTGAPVVPQSLSDVSAPEQYTSNTNETFVRLGEALNMSPIKAEHAFKAYTGYLGGYLMWGTDQILWDKERFGEKPDRRASDSIFLRRFITPTERPSSAGMEKFFKIKEQSDEVVATFRQQVDVRRALKGDAGGKFKDDRFYGLTAEEKEVLFALNDSMNKLIKLLYGKEGMKTAEQAIKYNKNLTGAQKRDKIESLWRQKNKALLTYYKQADAALSAAKEKSKEQEK